MTKVYSHLSAQERIRIDELRNRDGLGVCQIALRIGRDKSTVSREPGRGLWVASDENGSYPALQAETAEDGRVDVPSVLLGHDRAEEGRDACARIPQALRMSYPPRCPHGSWTRSGRGGRPNSSRDG